MPDILQGDPVFPTIAPFLAVFLIAVVFYSHKRYKQWSWKWFLQERVKSILFRVYCGTANPSELLANSYHSDGQIIGWVELTHMYQRYVNEMPMQKRHELIDKLLQNQEVRCKGHYTNMQMLIDMMNPIEIETLMYVIGVECNAFDQNGRLIRQIPTLSEGLANEVIAFRLGNPY